MRWVISCFVGFATLIVSTPSASAGLIGYWKLDGDLTDASGGGFDGTFNKAPASPTFVVSPLGQAMDFDDSSDPGDVVLIADDPKWDTGGAVTVSQWFNTQTIQSGRGFLVHDVWGTCKYSPPSACSA